MPSQNKDAGHDVDNNGALDQRWTPRLSSKLQGSRRAKMTHDPKKNHYNWKIHFCYFLSHEIHIDALLCLAHSCAIFLFYLGGEI